MRADRPKDKTTQTIPEFGPSKPPGINASAPIERASFYAKILFFRDRHKNEQPFVEKPLSLLSGRLESKPDWLNKVALYDEASYLKEYHLHKNHPDTLTFESKSSGITDVIGLRPDKIGFPPAGLHEYEQTNFGTLQYTTTVRGANDIQIIHKYYNGFQRAKTTTEKENKYESDGGFRVPQDVAEAVVTFDFSAITTVNPKNRFRIIGEPTLMLYKKEKEEPTPIHVRYTDGILISDPIKDIAAGTYIKCDWVWETESDDPVH